MGGCALKGPTAGGAVRGRKKGAATHAATAWNGGLLCFSSRAEGGLEGAFSRGLIGWSTDRGK